jgi:D-3-phosphoglycerate dehydrogenase
MKVAIGTSSFAAEERQPLAQLETAGVEVALNPFGRRLSGQETLEFYRGKDGILAGLERLDRAILSQLRPTLKAIARVGIGISNVDVDACRELGIKFSFTPAGPTEAVAEMTLAALLCLTRNLDLMNRGMHRGEWPKSIGRSLSELTVLVVGCGRIGRRVAQLVSSLGSQVLICDPFLPDTAESVGAKRIALLEGLGLADVISLHASGASVILGKEQFAAAKPGLILLNCARGELVEEAALLWALETGIVSRAWLDTFWQEPYKGPLLGYEQVLLTPHASTYTRRCRLMMETQAVENLLRDLGLALLTP